MILIGRKRTKDEFAHFVQSMANITPHGFRQPGRKTGSTSLVQEASIAAGWIDRASVKPDQSKRAEKKAKARALTALQHRKTAEIGIDPKYRMAIARAAAGSLG